MPTPLVLFVSLALAGGRLSGPEDGSSAAASPAERAARRGWSATAPRAPLAARSWVEELPASGGESGPPRLGLGLAGRGSEAVDGRWVREVELPAGEGLRFEARYRAWGVASERRDILARVLWLSAGGDRIGRPEYPPTLAREEPGGWRRIAAGYRRPEGAAKARIELQLRWSARGSVVWDAGAGFRAAAAPAPRRVRIAIVRHRPRGGKGPAENLAQFAPLLEEAGRRRADFVCLGEGVTVCGTGKRYAEVAEPVPGPTTRFLAERARRHRYHVVAGLYELDGTAVYNTAVLVGPDGRLGGKYRKVCLPREEIDGGITPGDSYPVFDTPLGRVGMMVCWDIHFPEVARALARRGAEVIFLPIWGGNETLARARAIENQVWIAASGYDFKTCVIDRRGDVIAEAREDPEVVVVEIDLGERTLWPWLGDFRGRIPREAPVVEGERGGTRS